MLTGAIWLHHGGKPGRERQTQRLAARSWEAMVTEIDLGSGWRGKDLIRWQQHVLGAKRQTWSCQPLPVVASAGQS